MSWVVRETMLMCILAAAMLAGVAGCARHSHPVASKPVSKPLYIAPPDRVQTSTLLDFDNALDTTFIDAPAVRVTDDPMRAGNRVLVADGGIRANLTSLVRGRDIGGVWDVIGLRIWSNQATTCKIDLAGPTSSSTQVSLMANVWTKVWMSAPRLLPASTMLATTDSAPDASNDHLKLSVSSAGQAHLLVDDVALAQSRVTVSQSLVPKSNERWRVVREGLKWIASVEGRPIFELPAAPFVANGYRMLESDPTRALFANDSGSTLCIDRTGRLIEDGDAKLDPTVLMFAKAIAENASPATIEIVGNDGRIERSLPGDRNNDGYDERRGVYAVRAAGIGRVAVRLTRQKATVKWPALEIYDLPPGAVSVWLDGAMIPWAVRAGDGRVIVELPIELELPVEVQVRVK